MIRVLIFTVIFYLGLGTSIWCQQVPKKSIIPLEEYQFVLPILEQVPDQLWNSPYARLGWTELAWQSKDNTSLSLQQGQKQKGYRLYSSGFQKIDRFHLFGKFRYRRDFDDSVAWLNSATPKNGSPFYLANIKAGNWDVESYQVMARAGYELGKEWMLGFTPNYEYSNQARGNDPRGDVSQVDIKHQVFISYKPINSNFSFGMDVQYGELKERLGISNKNDAHNSFGAKEYNIYTILGHGFYKVNQNMSFRKNIYQNQLGFWAKQKKENRFRVLRYTYDKNIEHFQLIKESGALYQTVADYSYQQHVVNFLSISKQKESKDFQELKVAYSSGKNTIDELAGNNYSYKSSSLEYHWLSMKQSATQYWFWDVKVGADWMKKTDAVTQTDEQRLPVWIQVKAGKALGKSSEEWVLSGKIGAQKDLNPSFVYNSSIDNKVIEDLFLPLHRQETSTQWNLGMSMNHHLFTKGAIKSRIQLEGNWLNRLDHEDTWMVKASIFLLVQSD